MPRNHFALWLEFEQWLPSSEQDPECDGFNMQITLHTGEVYALNVWTYALLDTLHRQMRSSGEQLHGAYLLPPDLFVQRLDRSLLERIVQELIDTHQLRSEWRVE